jgi:hypothetical protein
VSPSTEAIVKHFPRDLPAAEARALATTQGPIVVSALGTKVSNVAWKTEPSWYIVGKNDQTIAPDEERFFARRMKATTTELDTRRYNRSGYRPKTISSISAASVIRGYYRTGNRLRRLHIRPAAQLWRDGRSIATNGYVTAWIGKKHNTPTWGTSAAGLDVGVDVGSAIEKIAKVTIELGPMEVAPSKPEKKGSAKKRSGKSKTAA